MSAYEDNLGKDGSDQGDDSRLAGPTNNDKTTAGAANSDVAIPAEASAAEAGTAEISPDLGEAYRLFGPPSDNDEDNPDKAGAEKDSAEETSPDEGSSGTRRDGWMANDEELAARANSRAIESARDSQSADFVIHVVGW